MKKIASIVLMGMILGLGVENVNARPAPTDQAGYGVDGYAGGGYAGGGYAGGQLYGTSYSGLYGKSYSEGFGEPTSSKGPRSYVG